ncbi:DUF2339 domain-containing protein [Altericroceibacterium endophyticum]|uniref:DUF2339 domain-containing protein n=1 Tax=Altericroceibacterium endophyticum TaxID=1808508 RepID=A0A6I4T9U8_9SPHN|nr:DUF2339 domain-containing protein [Altericroceibacterium endophyticum]MXO67139.1 DUF2339 domain-containing protein [Altericroceibacterium endophyticum]
MEALLLLGLVGAVAYLWNRVGGLERRLHQLEHGDQTNMAARDKAAVRERAPAPAPASGHSSDPGDVRSSTRASNPQLKQPSPQTFDSEDSASTAIPARDAKIEVQKTSAKASLLAWRPSFDFEYIFGRLLPIWAGGITLAVAGFFLVRWSIENGLLNESVRVSLGFIFGAVLLAGAELAHRFSAKLADARVRQALAGAGLATLYASFYLAGSFYGLIHGGIAFAGLAGVTALAIALSYRFGLPSAVLGLLGGFAAPALAGAAEPNLPLLATYLALMTGGLVYTGRRQNRSWLGLAALGGGLGWGALMLISGPVDSLGILAIGGYLVLVGTMLPALMGQGLFGRLGRLAACTLATLQIAALVDSSGYSMLAWGAYILLAAAIAVLGWRNQRLREAGGIAAALSACLIAAWPDSGPDAAGTALAAVSAAMAAIFIGTPLLRIMRDEAAEIDWGQLALYPISLIAALCWQLGIALPEGQNGIIASAGLALALAPAAAAWIKWPKDQEPLALWTMVAFASCSALLLLAGLLLVPGWAAPVVVALIASAAFLLLRQQRMYGADILLGGLAVIGAILQLSTAGSEEFFRLVGDTGSWGLSRDTLRAFSAAVPFMLLVMRKPKRRAWQAAQVLSVIFLYGALAQSVPDSWLPTMVAGGVLALAWRMPWRAAHAGAIGIATLWALPALGIWGFAGFEALSGEPMMDFSSNTRHFLIRTLAPLVAAWIGSLLLSRRFLPEWRKGGWIIGGGLAVIMLHILYKAVFAITDLESFVALGMAERTLWQAAIAGGAIACLTLRETFLHQRIVGASLALLALAHFVCFTLMLHNPLWDTQAVGTLPIVNLLLPAYGMAIGALVVLRGSVGRASTGRGIPDAVAQKARPFADAAIMFLLAMLFLSELRQIFSGTILTYSAMTQQEDLLRSLLSIALALAYLGWGAWRQQRSWRIGSLVLMLLAVSKVFLFDAAGLEGLARIASFMALGLCLIGIGWFYSRQLKFAGTSDKEPR